MNHLETLSYLMSSIASVVALVGGGWRIVVKLTAFINAHKQLIASVAQVIQQVSDLQSSHQELVGKVSGLVDSVSGVVDRVESLEHPPTSG